MKSILRCAFVPTLFCLVSGCANIAETARPPLGYPAIKFLNTVELHHTMILGHDYLIPGGTILVGDHESFDMYTAYCGSIVDEASMTDVYKCLTYENNELQFRYARNSISSQASLNSTNSILLKQ